MYTPLEDTEARNGASGGEQHAVALQTFKEIGNPPGSFLDCVFTAALAALAALSNLDSCLGFFGCAGGLKSKTAISVPPSLQTHGGAMHTLEVHHRFGDIIVIMP